MSIRLLSWLPLALPTLLLPCSGQDTPAVEPESPASQSPAVAELESTLVMPLFLEAEPPERRTLRTIHLVHDEVGERAHGGGRTRAQALELAAELKRHIEAGESFDELARRYSAAPNASRGGVLGTFPAGMLLPSMDGFLYGAEVGELSPPIEMPNGIHLQQRIETYAGAWQILVRGVTPESQAKARSLFERIEAGEDFGALAREHSDDPASRERGGPYKVWERGPNDSLIKKAVFEAEDGQLIGPLETPLGYHIVRRVPVAEMDPKLWETTVIRVRAILVAHHQTEERGKAWANRTPNEAAQLATELFVQIREGADMAELARVHDDDPTGRARAGDLGWLHRRNPSMALALDRCFLTEPGELLQPIPLNVGWLIARREQ